MADEAERFAQRATQLVEQRARDAEDFTQRATARVMELSKGSQSDPAQPSPNKQAADEFETKAKALVQKTEDQKVDEIMRQRGLPVSDKALRGRIIAELRKTGTVPESFRDDPNSKGHLFTSLLPDPVLNAIGSVQVVGKTAEDVIGGATSPLGLMTLPGAPAGVTAKALAGSLAGGVIGEQVAGDKGRMAGEVLGGFAGPVAPGAARRAGVALDETVGTRLPGSVGTGAAERALDRRGIPGMAGAGGGLRGRFPADGENYPRRLSDYTDVLYRETDPGEAVVWLSDPRGIDERTGLLNKHFSNNPDLALGQGTNKGVLLELDPGFDGYVSASKPGADFAWQQGSAEFVSSVNPTEAFTSSVRRVTIRPDATDVHLQLRLRDLEQKGWVRESAPDGSLVYSRPDVANIGGKPTAEADALNAAIRGGEQGAGPKEWVGQKVRAADRQNIGEVLSVSEDGLTATVLFRNRKEGTHATVTIPVDKLSLAQKGQGAAGRTPKKGFELPTEPPEDPVVKLSNLLREAKPVRAETQALYSKELAKRAKALSGIQSRGLGREGYYKQLSAMKGELPKSAFDPPEASLSPSDMDGLHNRIDGVAHLRPFEKLNAHEALDKTLLGQLPTDGEIANLESVFGTPFAEQLLKFRGNPRGYEQVMDAAGIPRAFMSALDASAPLRQGFVATVSHPTQSVPAMRQMFKAMLSEKNAAAIDESILNSPRILMKKEAGLYLAPRGAAAKVAQREETFATRFARKIPGVQMSERGFVTYLNKLRSDVFDMYVDKWERVGYQYTDDDLKKLASFINHATGRGDIGALGDLAPAINATIFSPRLFASRIQTGLDVGNPIELVKDIANMTPSVRKLAARDLAVTLGVGTTTLGLMAAAGGVVELDPRSTDFGKARFGKQRIDIWGSYQPLVRNAAQLITGQRKTQTGEIVDVDRKSVAGRFTRSKMSPTAGFITDAWRGENVLGQEMAYGSGDLRTMAWNNFMPLFAQDLRDAFVEEGFTGTLRALPAGLGASVQTYEPSTSYKLQQALQEKYPDRERNKEVDNVLINDDPELRAMRTKGYEEAAAQGQDYAKEAIETDKWKASKEQELHLTDSARGVLAKDPGSGKAFTEAYSTFQDQVVGQISREMFGTEDRAKKTPAGQALLALRSVQLTNYYDSETYSYDYEAYDRDRTKALAALKAADPLVASAVERRMSTVSPEVRAVEAQFKQARELKNQYYEKPKYKGLNEDDSATVDAIRAEADNYRLQSGGRMSIKAAIRRVVKENGVDRKLARIALLAERGSARVQDPARDEFLIANPEILRFYPRLADTLSNRQKFKLPNDIILGLLSTQTLARTG